MDAGSTGLQHPSLEPQSSRKAQTDCMPSFCGRRDRYAGYESGSGIHSKGGKEDDLTVLVLRVPPASGPVDKVYPPPRHQLVLECGGALPVFGRERRLRLLGVVSYEGKSGRESEHFIAITDEQGCYFL